MNTAARLRGQVTAMRPRDPKPALGSAAPHVAHP